MVVPMKLATTTLRMEVGIPVSSPPILSISASRNETIPPSRKNYTGAPCCALGPDGRKTRTNGARRKRRARLRLDAPGHHAHLDGLHLRRRRSAPIVDDGARLGHTCPKDAHDRGGKRMPDGAKRVFDLEQPRTERMPIHPAHRQAGYSYLLHRHH